ncbi:MAG: hypothetical protein R6X33_04850 [Candidatus Brocadiia bacterium]
MAEKETNAPLRVDFDSSVKIRFVGAQVSSDAGPADLPGTIRSDIGSDSDAIPHADLAGGGGFRRKT